MQATMIRYSATKGILFFFAYLSAQDPAGVWIVKLLLQKVNTLLPIIVTLPGRVIFVKLSQP